MTYRTTGDVRVLYDIDPVPVSIDSIIPLSLIVNELVTNSFKYAFPDNPSGTITIGLRRMEKKSIELTISDDGVGLPENFDFDSSSTLGMQLIRALSEQIDGTLSLDRSNATRFTIVFPEA